MSPLLLTALVLFAGWIALGAMLWWLSNHHGRLAERIEQLEKNGE